MQAGALPAEVFWMDFEQDFLARGQDERFGCDFGESNERKRDSLLVIFGDGLFEVGLERGEDGHGQPEPCAAPFIGLNGEHSRFWDETAHLHHFAGDPEQPSAAVIDFGEVAAHAGL